ncbi:MAG TPA: hypothetical protein VK601_09920, partial [Kofleriaceae bacterium]|nr:hypothetical protein [Kofleriaceae bacterium]
MACSALLITACGAGDNRLDPGDLELRDLLGIAPELAGSWDRDQRSAARHVIEAGLRETRGSPSHAALGDDPALDRRIAAALASADADRARHRDAALGVVDLAVGARGLVATPHPATLEPRATPAPASEPASDPASEPESEIELRGWDSEPSYGRLPARGMAVLAALARDAGHRGGPIVVAPAPQLAVAAGYVPATATAPARLVVNPVVLAALEPREAEAGAAGSRPTVARTQRAAAATAAAAAAAERPTANAAGNPYSFYGSVAECAAAQRDRCEACTTDRSCTAITDARDGNAECEQLAASAGRGYYLICIDLAIAID